MNDDTLDFSTTERLQALIETLDAYISHYHGGSVEMVGFDGHTLKVRLGRRVRRLPSLSDHHKRLGSGHRAPVLSRDPTRR